MDVKKYPGLGDYYIFLPDIEGPYYPTGVDYLSPCVKTDILPIREVAMMSIMEEITNKSGWEDKVFDQSIVRKWRKEALNQDYQQLYNKITQWRQDVGALHGLRKPKHIMSEKAFDYCILELQNKATYYKHTRLIPTLDTCSTVVKSDIVVPTSLCDAVNYAFTELISSSAESPDWHPGSDEKVLDFVHPSLHPLVYGRTRAIQSEIVGIDNAVDLWAGKGDIIPKDDDDRSTIQLEPTYGYHTMPRRFWSKNYQWLPANVCFENDSKRVKITSYINNLHPKEHAEIYGTLEHLIGASIPLWDQCLKLEKNGLHGPGRTGSRFTRPKNVHDDSPNCWNPQRPRSEIEQQLAEFADEEGYIDASDEDCVAGLTWLQTREPVLTEPDTFTNIDYAVESSLRQRFEETGLQVIVKIASIELKPEKPEFEGGSWHVEGQMNERICATALYYADCENVTSSYLSFRQPTDHDEVAFHDNAQNEWSYLEQLYGTGLDLDETAHNSCIQYLGEVETRQGRLLAFPNTLQHRVSPFRLVDPTKPGHRRFVALWLVDPHVRIISTANVPPQQGDWWLESIYSCLGRNTGRFSGDIWHLLSSVITDETTRAKIEAAIEKSVCSVEILQMIEDLLQDQLPMSRNKANEHRLKLMDERKAFVETSEDKMYSISYGFCEH